MFKQNFLARANDIANVQTKYKAMANDIANVQAKFFSKGK